MKVDLVMRGMPNLSSSCSPFVSERTIYESASGRDDRFEQLVAEVTAEDPDWARRLIPWLRNEAQMRSASLVAAAEYVKAGGELGRQVERRCRAAAPQRADDLPPGGVEKPVVHLPPR